MLIILCKKIKLLSFFSSIYNLILLWISFQTNQMPLSLIIMYIIIILITMYISCPCCKLRIYLVMLFSDYLLLDSLKKISTGSWFYIKACNFDTSRISITSLQIKQLIFHKLFQILSISPTCKQVLWSGMLDGHICSLSGSL